MRWAWNRKLRTPDKLAMRFVNELGGRLEAFGLARREDQKCFGVFALQSPKRDEGEWLFCGDNASCNDDW